MTLRRLEGELDRRKRPGFSSAPPRDHAAHGEQLRHQIAEIVQRNAERTTRQGDTVSDPTIILRVNMGGYVAEDSLGGLDLQILEQRSATATVVLSNDPQLSALTQRSALYAGPIPPKQIGAVHASFFDAIDSFDELDPTDRIGGAFIRHGFVSPEIIPDDVEFLVDVELWDLDDAVMRDLYLARVERKTKEFGGELLSRYRGAGIFVARVRVPGSGLRELLAMKEIAWIDLPPVPDFAPDAKANMIIDQLPPIAAPLESAICIGIIDSGIAAAHPMLKDVIAGAFGVPERLGSDDEKRHGTAVAALASYGSISHQLQQNTLVPRFRVASAKVVDANGKFAEERTIPDIVEEAIRRLHDEFGCRVINVSLADIEHLVGERPSNWAMTLDNLVRELGVIITLSAGNIRDISHRIEVEGIGIYPQYLLEDDHRLYEPASSVNSLVVGSLAHSSGLMPGEEEDADIVALTVAHHPSPFSRSGPGFDGGIKPDLVEYGGTAVWHGYNSRLSADRASCGVLTLNPNYLQSLMDYRHGTSFAAPVAAFKAATLLEEFPNHSANFIRSLMGLSTDHPDDLVARVRSEKGREHYRYAGYGVAEPELALASDDGRVVMTIEDSLAVDRFAVYEIPIPSDFQTVKGTRHIKVSLAFDPPVRNSRKEYLGINMNYRLVRGKSAREVFDRFRAWSKEQKTEAGGPLVFEGNSWFCPMMPPSTMQEAGSLQVGTFVAKSDISHYGDHYFLVVRCEGKWASKIVDKQTYAVSVELWHEAQLNLYQQVAVILSA